MAESKLEASPAPATATQSGDVPFGLQVAQAGTAASPKPVGQITVLEGSARATHANAEVVELKLGDPVYEGDTVETGPGSTLAITFTDHSVVTLSENARMVIEVLIYDPSDNQNLLTMTMVQGEFLLFSGDIAGSGKMLANTPVGQLDVTGTGVFAGIGTPGAPTTLVLVTAGLFTLIGSGDSTVFRVLGEALRLLSADGEHPEKVLMDLEMLAANNPALFSAAQLALSLVRQQLELEPDGQGLESIVPEAGEDGGQSFPGPPSYPGLDETLFEPLGLTVPGADGQPSQDPQGLEPSSTGQSSGLGTTTAFRLITLLQTLADLLPAAAPEAGTPEPGTPAPGGGAEAAATAAIFALVDSAITNEDSENTAINLLAGAGGAAGGLSVAAVTDGASGTVAIVDASTGLIAYLLPAGLFNLLDQGSSATDSFTYTLVDSAGATVTQTVTITILGLNDPPAAVAAAGILQEDGPPLAIDLAGNITDPDQNAVLTVTATSGSNGGTTSVAGTVVTFTQAAGFYNFLGVGATAQETFDYIASDELGAAVTATVTVTIVGVNDTPLVELNKLVSVPEGLADIALKIALPVDPDSDALTATVTELPGPMTGTVNLADGTKISLGALFLDQLTGLTFTAGGDAVGQVSPLTYSVDDGNGGIVSSTITLSVTDPEVDQDVTGGAGNDILIGGAFNDVLAGVGGDDHISGSFGEDRLFGGEGSDQLFGDQDDDTLAGENGDDLLYGDDGDDLAYGGGGEDTLYGEDGDNGRLGDEDRLYGDSGGDLGGAGADDTLYGEGGEDRLYGDAGTNLRLGASGGNDLLYGGFRDDSLFGDAGGDLETGAVGGNDRLFGNTAEDRIYGDAGGDLLGGALGGADMLDGGGSPDRLYGDAGGDLRGGAAGGGDLIYGVGGDDALYGDAGDDAYGSIGGGDTLYGGERDDKAFGDFGDHQYGGVGGDDTAYGGPGDDTIAGDSGDSNYGGLGGNDSLYGEDGSDTLIGDAGDEMRAGARGGDDTAFGDGGNDRLFGDAFDDLYGGATQGGNDLLYGGGNDDQLYGDAGDDVFGGAQGGSDTLYGDSGDDRLYGDNGETLFGGGAGDTLYGGAGGDELYGDAGLTISATSSGGNDLLYGGAEDDTLYGDAGGSDNGNGGDDTLFGNQGSDTLTGGAGADRFILAENDGNQGNQLLAGDLITDFTPGIDTVGLQGLLESQIMIADPGGSATVTVVATGEVLAVLDGVQSADIQIGVDVIFL